ncbi:MAG: immunoglobulin domain-containing protein [Opitutae bacterium]|nr:immunoglobulin domain-containing protein [Opitutae bacterium]
MYPFTPIHPTFAARICRLLGGLILACLLAGPALRAETFTLAVTPDSQQEVLNAGDQRFRQRMQWIADNREKLRIKMMLHVGDMLNWDTPDHIQYERASAGLAVLDQAGVPYALALGNHDTAATKEGGSAAPGNVNTNLRNTTTHNAYFPPARFLARRGAYEAGKTDNAYHIFTAGGLNWLVLNLELWARTGPVEWAKGVVQSFPDHNVIILTHSHLNGGTAIEQSNGGYGDNSPQYVFDQLIKTYANIRLVFCGHAGNHTYRKDTGTNGNAIYQFLQCYHDNATNPVRLFEIDPDNGTLKTWVYCPSLSQNKNDGSAFTVTDIKWVAAATPPVIVTSPASQTMAPGGTASFAVTATSATPLTYQWHKNSAALPGATSSTLTVSNVSADAAGDYTVVVSNVSGATTSQFARLVVAPPEPGRLINLSVRTTARSKANPLIVGCVMAGDAKPMLLRASGPALADYGVSDALPDPCIELHALVDDRDTITASNNNWGTGDVAALRAAFAATGAFALPDTASKDAALLLPIEGTRSLFVYDTADRSGVTLLELYDAGSGNASRLVNLSTRSFAGTGDRTLIAGFVISGNTPKQLLLRGVGPTLASFGVGGTLADPRLELHTTIDGRDTVVASNDNWGTGDLPALRAAGDATGAFALPDPASKDAALLLTLPAGTYSAQITGNGGSTGEVLFEIYEVP